LFEKTLVKAIKKFNLDSLTIKPTDNYYDHITFSVSSLSEFISLIEMFATLETKCPGMNLIYRGMVANNWKLVPSIMRMMSEHPHSYTLEHDLAVEFSSEMPFIFQNSNSDFEKIAKMQHFGIPTRLLDFTLNPLIALYFACADLPRRPGRVVFTLNKLHHFDDRCVECNSSLYLSECCDNIKIDDWLSTYNLSVSDYLFSTYTDLHDSSPLFVKPPYLDDRMREQRSVFLLFHNHIRDTLADSFYYKYKEIDPMLLQYENVEQEYKEQIEDPIVKLDDSPFFLLDKTSFNRIADSYRKNCMDDFSRKTDAAFANRFVLKNHICPLEPYDIWFNFSSIIIPSKCKKTILSQLEHIGIDEAFVYPEAEHMAKRIKKQQR